MADQQDRHLSVTGAGMNMNSTPSQLKQGELSYVLNGVSEGFDGQVYTIQSEQSNEHCVDFPALFRCIGAFNIPQINKTFFFLVNPENGDSQIGYTQGNCEYTALIIDGCLGFSIEHPIHQIVVKSTNCSTQFYWTDNYGLRRYIDLENLPWKEEINPDNDARPIILVGQVDCNKLLVQPNFSIPSVKGIKEVIGGSLKMGAYQAAIQYANVLGEGLTQYYNVSNPFNIYKAGEGIPFDAPTNKGIEYQVNNLDTSGLYDYFNIAVIQTINGITTPYQVATLPITGSSIQYTYTGTDVSPKQLDIKDIFLKYKYFDRAGGVMSVDDTLVWYDLTTAKDINYQQIASKLKIYWETSQVPYNKFEGYNNGLNSETLRSYLRDEVYPLELLPILRNGMQCNSFPIPGRIANANDLMGVTGDDAASILENPCEDLVTKKRWEVYNTGSVIGYSREYLEYQYAGGALNCYKGPYQYGEMSYWESTEKYPNNPIIWGELAGKPIRHHKFPDCAITPIHDNNTSGDRSYEHFIYPIGIRIEGLREAIEASDLTQAEKDNIIGFKIVRGNRASNKSIIAKGMFNNVGKYTYVPTNIDESDSQTYYYPNYPFNDLRPDPFFTKTQIKDHSGYRPDMSLNGFEEEDSKSRFSFYSPDTQFEQPTGIDSGHMKVETIEYGESYGHFVPVDENAEYLFLNKNGYKIAYGAGVGSTINGTVTYDTPWDYGVGATFHPENFPTTYQAMLELLNKIFPYTNFGYSFNSVGYYNKSFPVPNDGNKIRNISFGKYLKSEYETIEAGNTINNYQREGSVYLNTDLPLPYPHQYDSSIPQDNSRYNLSSFKDFNLYDEYWDAWLASNTIVDNGVLWTSILNTLWPGPDMFFLKVETQVSTLSIIQSVGDILEYYSGATLVGTLKIESLDVTSSGSGPITYTIDMRVSIQTGILADFVQNLQLDSSNHSGTGPSFILYTNPNHDVLVNITHLPGFPFELTSLTQTDYQGFISTNTNELYSVMAQIRSIWFAITTKAQLQALDITNPTTTDDFVHLAALEAYNEGFTAYQVSHGRQYSPDKIRTAPICSYYGSIKKTLLNQWGAINSYEIIDTGFYSPLRDASGDIQKRFPTIFGGDTYITRHAYKTKLPFFEDNTVKNEDGTDIEYDKIATLTYAMFWFSTRPTDIRSNIADFLEKKAQQIIKNGATLDAFQVMLAGVYGIEIAFKVIKEILAGLGVRNMNLDNLKSESYYEQGLMYLFAYGIPYFFCESEINTEYRHAKDAREGNFYPNVAGEIPDEWFQEANVSIKIPEVFDYNTSYSKQNKENYFSHLRLDYDPDKACFYEHNNMAVWSDKSNLEETKNHWLTYRPANFFNFPKSFGKLVALDAIRDKVVLARFENKSQLYNAMVRINTSSPEGAYVGNDALFSGTPPISLSEDREGAWGTQHKFLLNTLQGAIYVDAKRGQVVLVRGQEAIDISEKGMDKWFKHFLPFFILQVSEDVPTDNHFNGIGLTGTYDGLYKRAIITKKDYEPLVEGITYNSNGEFIFNRQVISLEDSNYFCDRSWTLSFCFASQSWTSFHSYIPDYYIQHAKRFQTGKNGSVSSLWNHNTNYSSYHNFYGTIYPYIIEYPVAYSYNDEILQNIKDATKARRYTDYETFTEPNTTLYFNKAIIFNDQQCSGLLNLVPNNGGLFGYSSYPKYNGDSKDVLVTKSDSFYNINMFWNITKTPNDPIWNKTCSFRYTNKTLNFSNLDYTQSPYNIVPFRAKEAYIRLIADESSDVRLISRFLVSETRQSLK